MRVSSYVSRNRKAPTLVQNSIGAWYANFRREGVYLPLGIQTPRRPKSEPPPTNSRYEWVSDGRYHYPKHVYDKFQADYELPYLRGEFELRKTRYKHWLEDAIHKFVHRKGVTEKTRLSYESTFNTFMEHVPDRHMRINELTSEDIERFLERDNLSVASRASYARQINAFINWAVRRDYLDDNSLTVQVKKTTTGRLGRKLFLYPNQYLSIRDSVQHEADSIPKYRQDLRFVSWALDVYDLGLATGLRTEELQQLQTQDIRLDRGILEVRPKSFEHDGLDFTPKGKRARFVELHPRAVEVLSRPHIALRLNDPHARILTGPDVNNGSGEGIDTARASRLWRKHRKKISGVDPVPLHGLRHMFVTYLLILGYETFYVQNWAGHESIKTTEGYAQFCRQLCSRRERDTLKKEIEGLGFLAP